MLALVVAIGVAGHLGRESSAPGPTPSAVAVAVPASPRSEPSTQSRVVPVDHLNKFVIDDVIRSATVLRWRIDVHSMALPRAI